MININLYPVELRKKKKSKLLNSGLVIPIEVIIGSAGGLLMLLVCTHIVFMVVNMSKLSIHKDLQKQWEELQPAKKNVDTVVNNLKDLREKRDALLGLLGDEGVSWSQKLNIVSNSIPDGIWLRKLNLTTTQLLIEGSAISRQKQEMITVHGFTSKLKKNSDFLLGFDSLELGSMQRRKVNTMEIVDFLIKAKLKIEEVDDE